MCPLVAGTLITHMHSSSSPSTVLFLPPTHPPTPTHPPCLLPGSCALMPPSAGNASAAACGGLVPPPLGPADPSAPLTCPDMALTTFKAASCNYTGLAGGEGGGEYGDRHHGLWLCSHL
jgi:hypothetical protein